jgi:hypothetical protein
MGQARQLHSLHTGLRTHLLFALAISTDQLRYLVRGGGEGTAVFALRGICAVREEGKSTGESGSRSQSVFGRSIGVSTELGKARGRYIESRRSEREGGGVGVDRRAGELRDDLQGALSVY